MATQAPAKLLTLLFVNSKARNFVKTALAHPVSTLCAVCEKPAETMVNVLDQRIYHPANTIAQQTAQRATVAAIVITIARILQNIRKNESTKTCYQDPNFQLPGYYRCSIHTGKLDVEKDVTHCATECFAVDPDTNKLYAKKVHQINGDKPYRTCEQATKTVCK